MQKTYKENSDLWALDTDAGHILHRVGSDDYTEIRHTMVKDPEAWEEIAVSDLPAFTPAEYGAKVESLIRERYSASDEFALINNMLLPNPTEAQAAEYAAYQAYRAECKERARESMKRQSKKVVSVVDNTII